MFHVEQLRNKRKGADKLPFFWLYIYMWCVIEWLKCLGYSKQIELGEGL